MKKSITKKVHFKETNRWYLFDPEEAIGNESQEELSCDLYNEEGMNKEEKEEEDQFFWDCINGTVDFEDPEWKKSPAPKRPLEAEDEEAPPEHEAKRLRYKQPAFSPVSAPRRSVGLQEKASKNGKRKTRCSFCL